MENLAKEEKKVLKFEQEREKKEKELKLRNAQYVKHQIIARNSVY